VLADMGRPIEGRISAERQNLFKRRVMADFGFPAPDLDESDKWRIRVVARLLATDAATKLGEGDLPASEWVIPAGSTRNRALEILDQWQRDLQLLPKLEILAGKADPLLNLEPLLSAKLFIIADPLASYKAEKAVFQNEIDQINTFENFSEIATYLSRKKRKVEDADKDFGRYHALDLYTILATTTEDEWGYALKLRDQNQSQPGMIEAGRLVSRHFSGTDRLGIIRLKKSPYYRSGLRIDEFMSTLQELFP
jgi:hypothetical protein